ncbi:MAG: glycosyltransferase [Ruminococcus flavefaciens]|nr:glycosyltransferase [Ruminococcus flavefaciens]
MSRKWVTIFPYMESVHFNKDVGLIPKTMSIYYDYDSYIAAYYNEGTNFDCEDHVSLMYIEKKYTIEKLNVARFVILHAKEIDVLNTYHLSLAETILWIIPYKLINSHGKTYLKLDLSTHYIKDYIDSKVLLWARRLVLPFWDLISGESRKICSIMNKYYANKIRYIPNGFYWEQSLLPIAPRNNTILHVSRMGTTPKNTELLLQAFAGTCDKHNWHLKLIGTMEPDFLTWYQKFISENNLESRIIYAGEIGERGKLQMEYLQSKIFILTSLWESFGITMIEALSQGCYLIATDSIDSIDDIIANEAIGKKCKNNDINSVSTSILEGINYLTNNEKTYEYRMHYANEKYNWEKICGEIETLLR